MKRLILGIRRDATNREELRRQVIDDGFLPGTSQDVSPDLLGEYTIPEDVLLMTLYPETGQVPDILAKLVGAGFDLSFLSFNPFADAGSDEDARQHYLEPFETAARTMESLQLGLLEKLLKTTSGTSKKINLPTLNGFQRFEISRIIRCESTDNYTNVHFTDRKKILVSRSLQEFESRLAACGFFRVHHKHLINTEHIVEYQKGKGGQVIMSDNSSIDVSVRKKTEFMRYINDFS